VGTTGNTMLAIDWQKAKIVWRYQNSERPAEFRSSAAVTPEAVFVGSRDKLVHAIDRATGQRLWEFAANGRVDSSPVVVGDRVFVGSADGRLYALDRKTGRELWRFDCGGSIVASPAVASGCLVIGTNAGDLYCFGAK
jgi:outer membrane protein assembly factor BamB